MTMVPLQLVLLCLAAASYAATEDANLVLLSDAAKQGAVCLDGSPPGYYFRKGSGDGTRKWIVYMEGGGYCKNLADCYERSKTDLGSSSHWKSSISLGGFLSSSRIINPDFYDWTVVRINYCDGGIYSGSVDKAVKYGDHFIYFRGWRVLQANIQSLLAAGMKNATNIILSGGSAGAAATYLHADQVGAMVPPTAKYRAFPDAGYFIDAPNTEGKYVFREEVIAALQMQNGTASVIPECLKMYSSEPYKCALAPYFFNLIKTPLFMLNSQYDTWQIKNILQLGCFPPFCSSKQMDELQSFRKEWLRQAQPPINGSASTGVFADSCIIHTQSGDDAHWMEYKVGGQSMRDTFADWYFDRAGTSKKEVDCAYPCNKSCLV